MKLAIDAMGGDHAPEVIVKGAVKAIEQFSDIELILVGHEDKIKQHLQRQERITIIHTDEVITGDDEPVRAVRRKKDASMVLAAREVKEGRADALISAGNTGALVATGLFVVGRIPGIDRPALAPTIPTIDGKGFLLLDVGANSDAKPEHMLQNAYMGSIYSEKVRGIPNPRVGLLNIGTEEEKGNLLTKNAYELLKETDLNFIGNVEARDLLNGVADVVVTDGFTGNMVLKTLEGTAASLMKMLKNALTSSMKAKIGAVLVLPQLKEIKKTMDYTEHGGALLAGIQHPVIKAHGSSDEKAIVNAIRQARNMVLNEVTEKIKEQVALEKAKNQEN